MALLGQLLDVPVAPEILAPLSLETRQTRTFALLGHLIRQEAQQRPLILVVEDVHWIDPTSAAWLAFLVERLAGMSGLLLLTARPGYQAPWGTQARVTPSRRLWAGDRGAQADDHDPGMPQPSKA